MQSMWKRERVLLVGATLLAMLAYGAVMATAAPAQMQKLQFGGTGSDLSACTTGYVYAAADGSGSQCLQQSSLACGSAATATTCLDVADADKGDISISSGVWSVDSGAVAFSELSGSVTDSQVPDTITINNANNADAVDLAAESTDTTSFVVIADSAGSGTSQTPRTDNGLTYDASANRMLVSGGLGVGSANPTSTTPVVASLTGSEANSYLYFKLEPQYSNTSGSGATGLRLWPAVSPTSPGTGAVYGLDLAMFLGGTGDIPYSYGMKIDFADSNSGTIGTLTGLKIDAITEGSTNWAIASDGGNSYHVGNFRIGSSSAPTVALDVTGNIAASGTVTGSNLSGTNTGDQTNITGNAGTASALAANGGNCSSTEGSMAEGVTAAGVAECTGDGIASAAATFWTSGDVTGPTTTTPVDMFSGSLDKASVTSGKWYEVTVRAMLQRNGGSSTSAYPLFQLTEEDSAVIDQSGCFWETWTNATTSVTGLIDWAEEFSGAMRATTEPTGYQLGAASADTSYTWKMKIDCFIYVGTSGSISPQVYMNTAPSGGNYTTSILWGSYWTVTQVDNPDFGLIN